MAASYENSHKWQKWRLNTWEIETDDQFISFYFPGI